MVVNPNLAESQLDFCDCLHQHCAGIMVLGNALEQMNTLFDDFHVQNCDNCLFSTMSSHRSPSGSGYHALDLSCCAKYYFPYLWVVPSLGDNFLVVTLGSSSVALFKRRRSELRKVLLLEYYIQIEGSV